MKHLLSAAAFVASIAAAGIAAGQEDDTVVARVSGVEITMGDVYRRIEELKLGEQIDVRDGLPRFVDSVVREEMLFQYALAHFLDEKPALRDEFKALLVRQLIESRVTKAARITDEDVRRYYEANPSQVRGEHWRVRHIPLASHADCTRLMPDLTSEEAFTAAAREHGTDRELAAQGGDMGYFMTNHDVLGLGPMVYKLPLHTPFMFENQDGCHLIWVSEHLQPPMPPLEAVADRLRGFLEQREQATRLRALVDEASAAVAVERFAPPAVRAPTGAAVAGTPAASN